MTDLPYFGSKHMCFLFGSAFDCQKQTQDLKKIKKSGILMGTGVPGRELVMENISEIVSALNRAVWGAPALIMILAVGLYHSFGTRFVQIRRFGFAMSSIFRRLFGKQAGKEEGVSPFQAVCTALAATVGIGNIAGVAGAIALGGPGAVFWMILTAVLGMCTKYAEVVLAVRFRQRRNGEYVGGPMYYIQNGLGKKFRPLAVVFCLFGIIAASGVGNSTQVNTVVAGIHEALDAFGLPYGRGLDLAVGIGIGALAILVLLGGARRIGAVTEFLVPFMSLGYILLSLGVLVIFRQRIPMVLHEIISGAFTPGAVTGGIVGSCFTAVRMGVARGVFSNEAGLGTGSIAHAGANTTAPAEQGLYGIFEVFVDTVLICSMTALVILVSGVPIPYGTEAGAELTASAFTGAYGPWVTVFTAFAMLCFAAATVLGWGLYGIRCVQFLFGDRGVKPFVLLHGLSSIMGAVLEAGFVWQMAELVNGLMAIPNLVALALLSPEVFRLTREYFDTKKTAADPAQRAAGERGYYENFNQCQSMPAFTHAEVPPPGAGGRKKGKKNLSSEHRPA